MFACPAKALEDIRFADEQSQRDFRRAETTECFQSQNEPGIVRDRLIATNEKHSQQIVADLLLKSRGRRIIRSYDQFITGSLEYPQLSGIAPQGSNQVVMRDAVKPGCGIFGQAFRDPRGERRHQRGLRRIFDQVEVPDPDLARQDCDKSSVFVAEEILDQSRGIGQADAISRISTDEPGICIPGIAFTTATAPL
jgi:hypothetical protein